MDPTPEKTYIWITALGDPNQAVGVGAAGCVLALFLSNMGAAFGTARSGVGILEITSIKPELVFKSIIPVVMAGILGMYGLIIAIILKQSINSTTEEMWNKPEQWAYDWKKAYCHLASGLCVGMSGLASGMTIGICGDAGVRGMLHRDILIAVILLMIFAEAIALFGFIVGVVLAQS
mmetsp:Transcript_4256/g.5682  ORF Transcript_4256/g.5682 Transcript_4256/m.5682 type:complete len:177 (+) Transcript_4256:35-565(+)|eukprot:Macronucleus_5156.p1 GENE.Macronucleus_5156~~Macronucleus_5156.p1  ORF type:complete len:177 (+),score=44.26 Macronucleus_5156:1-531(+)